MRIFLLSITVCLCAFPALAQKLPKTIVHSPEVLYQTRQAVLKRNPNVMPAYEHLLIKADRALKRPAQSVVFKPAPPPGGNRHDYWSIAPYWWPNSETKGGQPYIKLDGQRNPEADSEKYDRERLRQTADDALTLALAWYLSGNEQYAGKGAALVFAWCGDSVTRMTPNFAFAQMQPGKKPGAWEQSPHGVVEGRDLIKLVEAARILEASHAWSRAVTKKVTKWFEEYIHWLRKSRLAVKAAGLPDNHGTWYDAQLAVFAAYVEQKNLARTIVGSLLPRRLVLQVEHNGAMPLELERTRSRHYTFFNLEAFFVIAAVGEHVGVDMWHWKDSSGISLQKAFDYAAPYLAANEPWPFGHIGKYDPFAFTPLFHRASMVYKEDRYREILNALPEERRLRDRAQLFY